MSKISIEGLTHIYPLSQNQELTALQDINLSVETGDILIIMGSAGCGKSTLLNLIAGLLTPASGAVLVDNKKITRPHHSRVLMFQQPCLLPWLTVQQNIAFGCNLRKEKEGLTKRVSEVIQLMGLKGFENFYPMELSLGMVQETALARALISNPEILLMDESFSHLDYFTRSRLMELLLELWKKKGFTTVFVTHDIDEAILLGTKIVIMGKRPGTIKHISSLDFPHPRNPGNEVMSIIKKEIMEKLRQQEDLDTNS